MKKKPTAAVGAVSLSSTAASTYLVRVVLVLVEEGWFVVGMESDGSEYRVRLVICYPYIGFQHARRIQDG
ncbi:MAG: hypothetical protein SX243_18605 [Acidobacteriota bacterium]|nr:hypothetical protein [Acidobacteriota bacterium]